VKTVRCGHVLAVIAASAAVATVSACGSAVASGRSVEPELGVIPVIVHYSDVSFPADRYLMTPDQRVTLARAADLVVWKCMQRFGFDYALPDRQPGEDEDRAIGVLEESEAAEFGYKNPRLQQQQKAINEEKQRQAKAPRSAAMVAVLTGEGSATYNGVALPAGGCSGEARSAVAGSESSKGEVGLDNFVLSLASESSRLAEKDSRLKAAFANWSRCMSEAGFHYSDPWAANDDPAFRGETASATEIATARADAACRTKFNVNSVWVAVRGAYQNKLLDQNAEALGQHRQVADVQLHRAADIVAAGDK
jgi:hypothetical protein